MRYRHDPPDDLLALAAAQAHTLSRRQCTAHGLSDPVLQRLIHTQWQVVTPGVYAVHRLPIPWLARVWVGVHLGLDSARVGGWAAAHLHGFAPQPELIQVWVDQRAPRPRPKVFYRQDTIGRLSTRDDLPRTTVADTVLDLCARSTPDTIATLIADACNKTTVTVGEILRGLDVRGRLPHSDLIAECLEGVTDGIHSALERRYVRDVEQAHGLPVAQRQLWTGSTARVDALLVEYALVIELDGKKGHVGTGAFRDMARDNRHQLQGLVTLRYGWDDTAGRPCEMARQIAAVIGRRGWAGPFLRCAHCSEVPWQFAV